MSRNSSFGSKSGSSQRNGGFGNTTSSSSSSTASSMTDWFKTTQKSFFSAQLGGNGRKPGGPVGTEAVALEQLGQNRKNFRYPSEGFVTPIEYSLIYSMIKEGPKTYPASLVVEQIREEDFREYLYVKTPTKKSAITTKDEPTVSYAQLSAILALSSVQWPPENEDSKEKIAKQQESVAEHSATDYRDGDGDGTSRRPSQKSPPLSTDTNVGQTLCKYLLRCVIRHAERHELDRNDEVQEFLQPVQIYSTKRENKAALQQILPMYIGYAASIVTANPIPIIMGLSVSIGTEDSHAKERENVEAFASETNRKADVETAGLLDEGEDMYDSD